MLYYYMESDNLAEAERTLTEARQDPSFIYDPTGDLARSLNALRARCQAQPSVEPVKVPTDLAQTVPAEISRAENVVAEPEADTLTKQSVGSTQTDEKLPVYIDTDGWESLDLTKIEAGLYALSFPGKNRLPSMAADLKAASNLNPALKPLYFAVGYACGNPLEELDYTPSHLMLTIDQ